MSFCAAANSSGTSQAAGLVREVHDAEQALVPERAGVGEQLPVLGQDEIVAAVDDELVRVPQADENTRSSVEHGIGPRELLGGVYLLIVRVHHYPGLALGEAGVFARVPLHGRPGVVAALVAQEAQHLLGSPCVRCRRARCRR